MAGIILGLLRISDSAYEFALLCSSRLLIALNVLLWGSFANPIWAEDSGVSHLPYEEVQRQMKDFAKKNPNLTEYVEYGNSVQGRGLSMLKLHDSRAKVLGNKAPAVEISGAIHGNEYLGIELELIEALIERESSLESVKAFLDQGGTIYGIPVLNPDGFSDNTRANAHGLDLNRDFDNPAKNEIRLTAPETHSLVRYLEQDLDHNRLGLAFSVDYHCCVPAMVMPWAYEGKRPSGDDLKWFIDLGESIRKILGFSYGNPAEIVGYTADGSSIDYFYGKYGTFAVSIEGRFRGERKFLDQHLQWLNTAIGKSLLAFHNGRK